MKNILKNKQALYNKYYCFFPSHYFLFCSNLNIYIFFLVKCVVTYNQPIKKYIFMNIIEQSCEKVG